MSKTQQVTSRYTDTPVGRFLTKEQLAYRVYEGREMTLDEQVALVHYVFDAIASLDEARQIVQSVTLAQ